MKAWLDGLESLRQAGLHPRLGGLDLVRRGCATTLWRINASYLHRISRGMERATRGRQATDNVQDGRGPSTHEAGAYHVLASRQTMLIHHVEANETRATQKSVNGPFHVSDVSARRRKRSQLFRFWN